MMGADVNLRTQLAGQRVPGFFDSKESWRRNTINETLYSCEEGMHLTQLGKSFNTKLRD